VVASCSVLEASHSTKRLIGIVADTRSDRRRGAEETGSIGKLSALRLVTATNIDYNTDYNAEE
jgi:hypothetical protein